MLTVFLLIIAGILVGRFAPDGSFARVSLAITAIVWMLLFLLGVEAGGDEAVVTGLVRLGGAAFVIFALSVAGSIAAAWGLWRWVRGSVAQTAETATIDAPRSIGGALRGSCVIVGFFVVGCIVGLMGWMPESVAESKVSIWVLYCLMFCVGISLGHDRTIVGQIRSLDPRLGLLPVATAIGTLAGAALATPLIAPWGVADSLAVGSGFGYYSLSSIFIADFRGAELATIALLCNILREIFTLLAAPIIARWAGPLAAISIGGATTFDTTLPIITQAAGRPYAVVAIFHGCALDFAVPFFVVLFCSL